MALTHKTLLAANIVDISKFHLPTYFTYSEIKSWVDNVLQSTILNNPIIQFVLIQISF